MSNKFNTAIILPVYNEDNNKLEILVNDIFDNIINSKIIIVDESKRNNSHLIKKLENKHKKTILYLYSKNKTGRGKSVLRGFYKAINDPNIEYFAELDSDGSHQIKDLVNILNKIDIHKADLIIASRYLKNSKIVDWPIKRRIFSYLSNLLIRLFISRKFYDYTNGLRAYNRKTIIEILNYKRFFNDNFTILFEVINFLLKKNFIILEIDSEFINRAKGKSSVSLFQIIKSLIILFFVLFKK